VSAFQFLPMLVEVMWVISDLLCLQILLACHYQAVALCVVVGSASLALFMLCWPLVHPEEAWFQHSFLCSLRYATVHRCVFSVPVSHRMYKLDLLCICRV